MAVDLLVATGPSSREAAPGPRARLEGDGHYWHLYPTFERLAALCGQMIDLYGDAFFEGQALVELRDTLTGALADVASRPDTWQVRVGLTVESQPREILDEVSKASHVALLERCLDVVRAAEQSHMGVLCLGD